MDVITGSPKHLHSPAELNPSARPKKKLMAAKYMMRKPKSRGATKKLVQIESAIKMKKASSAKAKLMSWSQGAGSAEGYMMSQGKRAPTNLSRDNTERSKKQEKDVSRKDSKRKQN